MNVFKKPGKLITTKKGSPQKKSETFVTHWDWS